MAITGSGTASAWSPILRSFGARALTLPISLVAAFVTIRVIMGGVGVDGYALYALIAAIPLMLPVADLGLGTVVTEAVALRDRLGDGAVRDVIDDAAKRMWIIATIIACVAVGLALLGFWAPMLGRGSGHEVEMAGATALVVFALSVPTSIGQRVLFGAGRNDLRALVTGLLSVYVLAFVGSCALLDAPVWLYPVAPGFAQLFSNGVCSLLSKRLNLWPDPESWERRGPAPGLWQMGLPMLVVMLALPVTFHSARIILSHLEGQEAVTEYTVAFQLYAPLFGIITVAGQALWPHFAAAGRGAELRGSFVRVTALFGTAGVAAGLGLVLLGPWLAALATDGAVVPSRAVLGGFAVLIAVQSIQYPAGMFLMDDRGLRLQALWSSVMAVAAVALSLSLTPALGTLGPIVAAAFTFSLFMLPATLRVVILRVSDGDSVHA